MRPKVDHEGYAQPRRPPPSSQYESRPQKSPRVPLDSPPWRSAVLHIARAVGGAGDADRPSALPPPYPDRPMQLEVSFPRSAPGVVQLRRVARWFDHDSNGAARGPDAGGAGLTTTRSNRPCEVAVGPPLRLPHLPIDHRTPADQGERRRRPSPSRLVAGANPSRLTRR